MNKLQKFFATGALCATLSLQTFAQDAVLDAAQNARNASFKGYKLCEQAAFNVEEANSLFGHLVGYSQTISNNFNTLCKKSKYSLATQKRLSYELKILSENLEQNKDLLKDAKTNLASVQKVLPLGEKLILNGDKIAEKLSDVASKNVGQNYQDKRYADSLIATWQNVKNAYNLSEKSLKKQLVDISVASPRLDGISNMSKMSKEFLAIASGLSSQNENTLKSYTTLVDLISEKSLNAQKNLNDIMLKTKDVKNEFALANLELANFISNELPQNPKYEDFVFKPNLEKLNSINKKMKSYSCNAQLGYAADAKKIAPEVLGNESNNIAYATKEAFSNSPSYIASLGEKPKGIQGEILELANKLIAITCQIKSNTDLISTIKSDAHHAIFSVEELETKTQNLLREVIDFSSQTQYLNSEIAIFKNTLDVNQTQSDVSMSEIENLCKKAEENLKECKNASSQITENLEKARKNLN